jgi:hypothetical protein
MKHFKTERDYPFLHRLKENYLFLKRDFQEIFRFVLDVRAMRVGGLGNGEAS